jgi:hypothetical protein
MPLSTATFHDAGLLRENVAMNYGHALAHGADGRIYRRADRLAGQVARLAGIQVDVAIADIVADYEILFA